MAFLIQICHENLNAMWAVYESMNHLGSSKFNKKFLSNLRAYFDRKKTFFLSIKLLTFPLIVLLSRLTRLKGVF